MAAAPIIRVILALDLGSSSIRCSAYRVVGDETVVEALNGCFVVQKVQTVQPNTGKINLEVKALGGISLLDLIDKCIDDTLTLLRDNYTMGSFQVVGVGFSSFVMNLVGVDEAGRPCGQEATMSYACNSSEVAHECEKLRQELGPDGLRDLHQKTGAPLHSSYALAQLRAFYVQKETLQEEAKGFTDMMVSKLLHQSRPRSRDAVLQLTPHIPSSETDSNTVSPRALPHFANLNEENCQQVVRWQTLSSICLARWRGTCYEPISYSEASWTGLFNFRTCTWDETAISLLPQACQDALPPLADYCDADVVGGIQEIKVTSNGESEKNSYWDRWPELRGNGTASGCLLFLGVGDGACANIGSKCITSSRIAVTIGTSAAARICLKLPVASDESMTGSFLVPSGLFCYRVDRFRVIVGGALVDGGSIVEWARKLMNLGSDEDFQCCLDGVAVLLNKEYETIDNVNSSRLSVVPFLGGERAVGYHSGASMCVMGLTRDSGPARFLKACLEGVVLRLDAILRLLRGEIQDREVTLVCSGAALERNRLWRQMLADCTGLQVQLDTEVKEGTSRGVARLIAAAIATEKAGCEKDLTEEAISSPKSCLPNMEATVGYWQPAYEAQEDLIDAVGPLWTRQTPP